MTFENSQLEFESLKNDVELGIKSFLQNESNLLINRESDLSAPPILE